MSIEIEMRTRRAARARLEIGMRIRMVEMLAAGVSEIEIEILKVHMPERRKLLIVVIRVIIPRRIARDMEDIVPSLRVVNRGQFSQGADWDLSRFTEVIENVQC
jgi:hypothetical protein